MTAMHETGSLLHSVVAQLTKAGIAHYVLGDGRIRVPRPNDFGELEIGAINTAGPDSIVGLVGHSWHTHGDVLSAENGGAGHVGGIVQFVRDIFAGRYLLIEETMPGKSARKTIVRDLDRYLDHLPDGATYKIYNGRDSAD